jgi:hypothetical protein
MRTLSLAGIVCALLFHAHATASSTAQAPSCSGWSPRVVVRSYYAAINHHQSGIAQACLTPYFRAQAARFVDPDWFNIAHVWGLQLRSQSVPDGALPGNVPPQDAKPYSAAQVVAQFTVRYYHVVDSPNGLTIRFIYAVKQRRHSPWRIAAIGSGP